MTKILRFALVFVSIFVMTGWGGAAFAQDGCSSFAQNPMWKVNFEHLQNEIFEKNYDAAIESAKALFDICPRSPAVNYYAAVALGEKGEKSRALSLLQKASEYTTEFSTSPEMSRLIWYARYEMENPEATPDALRAQKEKIEMLEAGLQEAKLEAAQTETRLSTTESLRMAGELEAVQSKYAAIMWTGTGIGALGIVSTITGAALAFTLKDEEIYEDVTGNDGPVRDYHIRPKYTTGLALFGTGLGLTVAGAVMAGFGAYQYVRAETPVSFEIKMTPSYAGFEMKF